MTPRRLARALALLAVVAVTAWLSSPRPTPPPPFTPASAVPTATPSPLVTGSDPSSPAPLTPPAPGSGARALPSDHPTTTSAPPPNAHPVPEPAASVPPAPTLASAAAAVDQVRLMLRDYRTLTGENPVGTNAEIMRALMGENPRQATLGPPEGQTLNAQGELVDPWNTPLFFHQLSRTVMEIRSAGPDRVMWTEDDVVTR